MSHREFEAHLLPMTTFSVELVEAGVADTRFAGLIRHFASVGSTNVLAMEAAADGMRAGVWVADEQTAGRGRGGHGWHSVVGDGLYVSVLLTPRRELAMDRALWIALATGLAAQEAIREVSGLRPDLRWPNDLILNGRKCGGILVETAVDARAGVEAWLRYAVIGVGINVNHARFPDDLLKEATSLRLETGQTFAREALLAALLRTLEKEMQELESSARGEGGGPTVLERFTETSSWVRGKRVSVEEGGGYTGVTAGLDARGFLRVEGDDGTERTVLSGGVRALD